MRTTVEIKPEHRSALLAIAALRGEKGFSGVLEEAIAGYLRDRERVGRDRESLRRLRGCLDPAEADDLRRAVAATRERWR